jgi:L-gulonate 5-dehydrogenase
MIEPFRIEIRDMPEPEPGPNEALVRMQAAGICGSDLHFYDGTHPYARYPSVFGHELCGTVEKLGSDVSGLAPGDKVIIEPAIPCGRCFACRIGKGNCCPNMQFIGAFGRQGGFAEYVAVPAANLHRLPGNMREVDGALAEPFTIGAQAVSRADVRDGYTVTILGMGPIGLTILILLKALHKVNVFAVDVVPARLEQAKRFGADVLINPKERDPLKAVEELTGKEGSNVVIEVAGLKQTMEQTIHMVSPGGRIVIVGLTRDQVSFPGVLFTNKEVEIHGSRNSAGKFPFVIDFLNRHPDICRRYITRTVPFESMADAFREAKERPHEITKIVMAFS